MADPVSATLFGVGTLGGGAGTIMKNMAEADEAETNANWLRQQADHYQSQGDELYRIRSRELSEFRGQQVTAMAGSGFSFEAEEGRALNDTDARIKRELANIHKETQFKKREALLKAEQYKKAADIRSSFGYNALGLIGAMGPGAANTYGAIKGKV